MYNLVWWPNESWIVKLASFLSADWAVKRNMLVCSITWEANWELFCFHPWCLIVSSPQKEEKNDEWRDGCAPSCFRPFTVGCSKASIKENTRPLFRCPFHVIEKKKKRKRDYTRVLQMLRRLFVGKGRADATFSRAYESPKGRGDGKGGWWTSRFRGPSLATKEVLGTPYTSWFMVETGEATGSCSLAEVFFLSPTQHCIALRVAREVR